MPSVSPAGTADKAMVLAAVCAELERGSVGGAIDLLRERYPFTPLSNAGRRYTPGQCTAVFVRDGFVDRYSGQRLVFPGALRLLSKLLPEDFPFHNNWKTDACHFAFYELFPTVDHVVPVSRGGADHDRNWVSTSMLRNSAKANFTLEELGWSLHPPGDVREWDGLLRWFLRTAERHPEVVDDAYLRRWHVAAASVPGIQHSGTQGKATGNF